MSRTTCAAAFCSRAAEKQIYVCAEFAKDKKTSFATEVRPHGLFYVRVHLCPRHLAAFWPQDASQKRRSDV